MVGILLLTLNHLLIMLKKIILTLLSGLLLFVFSCEQPLVEEGASGNDTEMTVEEARVWFTATHPPQSGARVANDKFWKSLVPKWNKAVKRKSKKKGSYVIVPLSHMKFMWSKLYIDPKTKKVRQTLVESLPLTMIGCEDKKNGKKRAFVRQYDMDVLDPSTGYIQYREWDGTLYATDRIEKGINKKRFFFSNKRDKKARQIGCIEIVYICYYQGEDCYGQNTAYGHNEYSLEPCAGTIDLPMSSCDNWTLVDQGQGIASVMMPDMDCIDYPIDDDPLPKDDGVGGGGDDDDESSCDATLSNLVNQSGPTDYIISEEEISESWETVRRNYKWVIYQGPGFQVLSLDSGVKKRTQNPDPRLSWMWQSFQHDNYAQQGLIIGGTFSYRQLREPEITLGTCNCLGRRFLDNVQ
jgi:hypothetical protein